LKPYLFAAGLIAVLVVGYQSAQMHKYCPTVDSFAHPYTETGILKYRLETGRDRNPPVVNGKVLSCGLTYFGPDVYCDERVRGLNRGVHLKVTFVDLASSNGPLPVASKIEFDDGRIYSASPEKLVADWKSASRHDIAFWFIMTVVCLIIIPALFGPADLRRRIW
jgi:hypothetical protein